MVLVTDVDYDMTMSQVYDHYDNDEHDNDEHDNDQHDNENVKLLIDHTHDCQLELSIACKLGRVDVVDRLLSSCSEDKTNGVCNINVNNMDRNGNLPLHHACFFGQVKVV